MFHAPTGCDTVSALIGHSKKSTWAAWNYFRERTSGLLLALARGPTEIPKHAMQVIERFVTLMYDKTRTCIVAV